MNILSKTFAKTSTFAKTASFITAAALMLSFSGCGAKEETAPASESAVNVTVYTVGSNNIENAVSYTGEVKEGDIAGVSSKVSAKVLSINADEGRYVNAGDVLATLDATDIRLSYNQALAAYNSAKANYDMVANSTTVQSETQARQAVERAQIEHDTALSAYEREKTLYNNDTALIAARNALSDANLNYDRMKQLFDLGSISQNDLDAAKTAVQNAQASVSSLEASKQASLENAKTRYVNALTSLNSAKETLDLTVNVTNEKSTSVSKANVDSAKAALDIASNSLANTTITAPISGYVASKNITKGQMVSPGVEIFTIKNTNNVEVQFNVTESVISSVHTGAPALISVTAANIKDIAGTVTALNQTKDARTGLYSVKVSVDNSNNSIKVGMFADVSLVLDEKDGVLTIPLDAVIQDGDVSFVYVANGTTAAKRDIVCGVSDGENTEVISGLNIGEQIVIKGKDYLSEKNNLINITQ